MSYKYIIYTLVDTSKTNSTTLLEKNQQRNLDTLEQVISLRCVPKNKIYKKITLSGKELNQLLKRSDLNNEYNVWVIEFENYELIDEQAINNDLDRVPIITKLQESINISPEMYQTSGKNANSVCVLRNLITTINNNII